MKRYSSSKTDDKIPGILILSHGPLAIGLAESLELISGEVENIEAFSLEYNDDPEQYCDEVWAALEKYNAGAYILCDLMGGTPANQVLLRAARQGEMVAAVGGANLAMLIEAVNMRDEMDADELTDYLVDVGKMGIKSISKQIKQFLES